MVEHAAHFRMPFDTHTVGPSGARSTGLAVDDQCGERRFIVAAILLGEMVEYVARLIAEVDTPDTDNGTELLVSQQ